MEGRRVNELWRKPKCLRHAIQSAYGLYKAFQKGGQAKTDMHNVYESDKERRLFPPSRKWREKQSISEHPIS